MPRQISFAAEGENPDDYRKDEATTVSDLIMKLSQFDPQTPVFITGLYGSDYDFDIDLIKNPRLAGWEYPTSVKEAVQLTTDLG